MGDNIKAFHEYNKVFANNLKNFLTLYDMTQADLAKLMNVGTTTVYSWVHAMKTPRMDKVDKLCEIFNCDRADLMMYKDLHTTADNIESAPEGYYTNPETAEIAQEIFDDPDLRTLFHVARNASPEQLKLAKEMLEMMKKNETNR